MPTIRGALSGFVEYIRTLNYGALMDTMADAAMALVVFVILVEWDIDANHYYKQLHFGLLSGIFVFGLAYNNARLKRCKSC